MAEKNNHYRFETLQLHVGQEQADPATDSRAVPIYATTSYVFHDFDHAEARFGLQDPGNIYGRLTNTTEGVFEDRIAALEGGTAGLAVASGAAAVEYAVRNITQTGDHIVASKHIYGGTFNLLRHTLPRDGVNTTFVEPSDPKNFEDAIQDNTKLVYIETFGNPNADLADIEAIADIAHKHNLPLVVDNTFAVPVPPAGARRRHRGRIRHQVHRRPRHHARRCDRRGRQVQLGCGAWQVPDPDRARSFLPQPQLL